MSVFTFDKGELEKLRRDLLADPHKYEKLFTREQPTFEQPERFDIRKKKIEEYKYWFRIMNEGRVPHESLPYYKQLEAYKDFVEHIEEKAYSTLKMTVARLLNDFEHEQGLNEVKEFA